MAPLAVIQPLVAGFHLDANSVQQLDGEEVGPGLPVGLRSLQAAVAEQQQAAGLCGAEVKRYGARLLCVPPGQCQVELVGGRGVASILYKHNTQFII
uniref:Uncharacterized protein n=1 Tax=Sparus aurata TaxID=8175 RepID=A0A671VA58_SPAAU